MPIITKPDREEKIAMFESKQASKQEVPSNGPSTAIMQCS